MIPKERRRAREWAMRTLYQLEASDCSFEDAFQNASEPGWDESRVYAARLVQGVLKRKAEIDAMIERNATGYALDRIAVVDLEIMRIATHEMTCDDPIAPAIAIDEAVELAKKYSTENSGSFINGVLAGILAAKSNAMSEGEQSG